MGRPAKSLLVFMRAVGENPPGAPGPAPPPHLNSFVARWCHGTIQLALDGALARSDWHWMVPTI